VIPWCAAWAGHFRNGPRQPGDAASDAATISQGRTMTPRRRKGVLMGWFPVRIEACLDSSRDACWRIRPLADHASSAARLRPGREVRQVLQHDARVLVIEIAGGLVGQQEFGLPEKRPGDGSALALARAEHGGHVPARSSSSGAGSVPSPLARGGKSAGQRRGNDVLIDGQIRDQMELLEDESDVPAAETGPPARRQLVGVFAGKLQLAAVGRSSPPIANSSVVLPQPLAPWTAMNWPPSSESDTPFQRADGFRGAGECLVRS